MSKSYVRHRPGDRACDVCPRTDCDPLWAHVVTKFRYCDDCRRAFPETDLVKVV